MELSKTEYASYSSPIVLVLGYFAGCGIGVASIWILTEFLSGRSLGLGFFDGFLRVLIMLAGTAVFLSVHFLPTYILGYKSGKIYRGRGFYRFINTVCVFGCDLFLQSSRRFLRLFKNGLFVFKLRVSARRTLALVS